MLYNLIILFAVINLNYLLFRVAPLDPVAAIIGQPSARDRNQVATLTNALGLDRDPLTQYLLYIKSLITFDFGFTFQSQLRTPVWSDFQQRIPNTFLLIGSSTLLSVVVGVALGVYVASKRGRPVDVATQSIGLFTYALPVFWIGLIFQLIFFYDLRWFPQVSTISPGSEQIPGWILTAPGLLGGLGGVLDRLWHLMLPMITLFLITFGGWALLMRNTLTDVFTEDYIVTARAKGLSSRRVLYKHALRNAMLPLVTSLAISVGFILSGATITETVFSWDGMGKYSLNAIQIADWPVLQAFFFLVSLMVILANFAADILYAILDPRVRY